VAGFYDGNDECSVSMTMAHFLLSGIAAGRLSAIELLIYRECIFRCKKFGKYLFLYALKVKNMLLKSRKYLKNVPMIAQSTYQKSSESRRESETLLQ
jgi:hypothetical protein